MAAAIYQMDEERDRKLLTEHADAIRSLGKQTVGNIIEIGRRLVDCRDNHLEHGKWLPWLKREFNWSRQTADRFIHIYEASDKLPKLSNLEVPVSGLYLLAAPSTPVAAREEVIARAEAGEALPVAEVKHVVEKHKDRAGGRKQPAKTERLPSKTAAAASEQKDLLEVTIFDVDERMAPQTKQKFFAHLEKKYGPGLPALPASRLKPALGNGADPEQSADRRRAEYAELAGGADPERVAEAPCRKARTEPTKLDSRPANYWINRLLTFHCDFSNEFRKWLSEVQLIEAVDEFHEGDREALIHRFQSCSTDLVLLSQEVRDKPVGPAHG
jgi:hypothetical protein